MILNTYYRYQVGDKADLHIAKGVDLKTIKNLRKTIDLVEQWLVEDTISKELKRVLGKELDEVEHLEDWRKSIKK